VSTPENRSIRKKPPRPLSSLASVADGVLAPYRARALCELEGK
jgi:hypothetical protein